MTNKEKARELSKKFARQYRANHWPEWSNDEAFHYSNEEIYNACLEIAAWKEQQMIEKAVEYINNTIGQGGWLNSCQIDNFIEGFKKAMED